EAGIERRSDDEADAMLARHRKQLFQRLFVVDQRILRRQQTDVRIGFANHSKDRLGAVHTDTPGFDDAFLAHLRKSRESPLASDLELLSPRPRQKVVVGGKIVDENNVDAIDSEPLQT